MKRFSLALLISFVLLVILYRSSLAAEQQASFFIDPNFDQTGRETTLALLLKAGSEAYFYVDQEWWNTLSYQEKDNVYLAIDTLDKELKDKIYPTLTRIFGQEWRPGIDRDNRFFILFHPMKDTAGGYFRTEDNYYKVQAPKSNEREMFYINTKALKDPILKSFVAHELIHLITFNQKDRAFNISEEIWLNELRAEYAPTLLGYDEIFQNSNLERRVKAFLEKPSDSLLEWKNEKADYGLVNLLAQYLVENYGIEILANSLKSKEVGIASLEEALKLQGINESFSDVFVNFAVAVLINDCNLGSKFCFKNQNLKNVKVLAQISLLPLSGDNTLTTADFAKSFSIKWYKIIGGKDVLKVQFQGDHQAKFIVPYLVENSEGKVTLQTLSLDQKGQGVFYLPDFNNKIKSVYILPLALSVPKEEAPKSFSFVLTISTVVRTPQQEEQLKTQLLAKIEELKKQLATLKSQLISSMVNGNSQKLVSCSQIQGNLFLGSKGKEVRCLQEFLKLQGPEIYPEGLVTGYFGKLTFFAVVRFQEKYASEILAPLRLISGTGFVGSLTRDKINQMLAK